MKTFDIASGMARVLWTCFGSKSRSRNARARRLYQSAWSQRFTHLEEKVAIRTSKQVLVAFLDLCGKIARENFSHRLPFPLACSTFEVGPGVRGTGSLAVDVWGQPAYLAYNGGIHLPFGEQAPSSPAATTRRGGSNPSHRNHYSDASCWLRHDRWWRKGGECMMGRMALM